MGMEITKLKVCTKQMNQDNDWIRTLFKKPPPVLLCCQGSPSPLSIPKRQETAFWKFRRFVHVHVSSHIQLFSRNDTFTNSWKQLNNFNIPAPDDRIFSSCYTLGQ